MSTRIIEASLSPLAVVFFVFALLGAGIVIAAQLAGHVYAKVHAEG